MIAIDEWPNLWPDAFDGKPSMAIADPRQEIEQVHRLLKQYFDLGACDVSTVVENWLQHFELLWIHNALIEALYQGRYKLVSVEQILRFWERRGQPMRHFSREFESIIYGETLLFSNAPVSKEPNQAEPRSLPHSPVGPSSLEYWQSQQAAPSAQEALASPAVGEEVLESLAPPLVLERSIEGDDPENTNPIEDFSECSESGEEKVDIDSFQPTAQPWTKPGNWVRTPADIGQNDFTVHPEPIQTFVPETHPSDLYERLQAVARQSSASV